jgi:uncharacterized RDD family membrane protein YckC
MSQTPVPAAPVVAENVLGIRMVAGLIDVIVLIVLAAVLSTFFGEQTDDGGFTSSLNGWVFWLYIVLCFAYFFVLENATGQTLGKRVMGIKVVAVDGLLTPQKVATRTLLRVVDGFPWFLPYLVGTVIAATSSKHQRIGDMAAKTLVVRV